MNAFEKEKIDWILEIRKGTQNTLVRRESTQLEFKRNFNFASICKYGKTLSSMANNKGGYIVFGVSENRPHELYGMSNDQFEKIDSSKISERFDEHFSPGLIWAQHIELRERTKIGFIYVESSKEKPVLCTKNDIRGEHKEGEIYYRYAGKTSTIKSSDLQRIIRDRIDNENMKWQRLLGNIAKISPSRVSLLNTESGNFIGEGNLIIDEKLLSEMKFIKAGEFNQVKGAPAYKVVGEIKDVSGATIIKKEIEVPTLIHTENIINSFLDEKCDDPLTYLKQFPYESTYNLPFWFFIKISDLSIVEVENIWKGSSDARNFVRNKLIERLKHENIDSLKTGKIFDLDGKNYVNHIDEYNDKFQECKSINQEKARSFLSIERGFIFSLINNDCLKHFTKEFIRTKAILIIEAFSNLEKEKIFENKEHILMILKEIYRNKLSGNPTTLRKGICYVDCALNMADVSE